MVWVVFKNELFQSDKNLCSSYMHYYITITIKISGILKSKQIRFPPALKFFTSKLGKQNKGDSSIALI